MTSTDARKRPLAGVGVLITRPAHQADHLAQLIEADGGVAVRFPTIEIVDPADDGRLRDILGRLDRVDIAIFVSPNAVSRALALMHARAGRLPTRTVIACVGHGTARELKRFGIEPTVVPARFDSDGLLGAPQLANVTGKQITIFRGAGGRELLGETLAARGARVEYAECYRRIRPTVDAGALIDRWAQGAIDIVTATSDEGLRNLAEMLGTAGRPRLANAQAVVVSTMQAATCRELGMARAAIVAREPSDEAILEAIRTWRLSGISI